jgi:hypothetical protein
VIEGPSADAGPFSTNALHVGGPPALVAGLGLDPSYLFSVAATNQVGTGPASAPVVFAACPDNVPPLALPPQVVPVGTGPVQVISTDLNGDGLLDLATADLFAAAVSVLWGEADGGFASHEDFPVGPGPQSLVAADFNADGIPDIATANYTSGSNAGSVSVLIGIGDGGFFAHRDTTITLPGPPMVSVVAGDFTRDGFTDLAIAASVLIIVPGDGAGDFGSQIGLPAALLAAGMRGHRTPARSVS